MSQTVFSKRKAKALFEAHKRKTGLSYSKLSLKLGKGSTYLSSVLAENREHAASETTIQAMARLLKVDPAALCENEESRPILNPVVSDDCSDEDCDVIVQLRKSTLDSLRAAIERLEGREIKIHSIEQDASARIKQLLREALMLL